MARGGNSDLHSQEASGDAHHRLNRLQTMDRLMRSIRDSGTLHPVVLEEAEELISDMRAEGHDAAVEHFSEFLRQVLENNAGNEEIELRFIRPKSFKVPTEIAGMKPLGDAKGFHRDVYFDTSPDKLGGQLRNAGCSFRIRQLSDGSLKATFKRKKGTKAAKAHRQEIEAPISSTDLDQSHPALDAAQQVIDKPLQELFAIDNQRTDHYFASPESAMILSEDNITYPDGSKEKRIELEHVHGVNLLDQCEAELAEAYKKIKPAPRGKLSEGRQRLSKAA